MILLKTLKKSDPEMYKAYRLYVKKRLFRHNEEVLAPMSREERIEKLEETYKRVEDNYKEIVRKD
jgi:histone acetyltransferase 1